MKRYSRVISMAVISATVLAMPFGAFAANRDFHTKDGSKTYSAAEWRTNPVVFGELINAIAENPDNLLFEFDGSNYKFKELDQKLSESTGSVEAAFESVLNDTELIWSEGLPETELELISIE